MRYPALLRMAVRSLMAQEKQMSASQPLPFLLRSLYLINLIFFLSEMHIEILIFFYIMIRV
jgi:hypothetical protein